LFPGVAYGSQPNDIKFLPDGTFVVSLGGNNALALFTFASGCWAVPPTLDGLIPTGWYPGFIAVDSVHNQILVSNVRGIGPEGPDISKGPDSATNKTGPAEISTYSVVLQIQASRPSGMPGCGLLVERCLACEADSVLSLFGNESLPSLHSGGRLPVIRFFLLRNRREAEKVGRDELLTTQSYVAAKFFRVLELTTRARHSVASAACSSDGRNKVINSRENAQKAQKRTETLTADEREFTQIIF
jgi:hypothetical protein